MSLLEPVDAAYVAALEVDDRHRAKRLALDLADGDPAEAEQLLEQARRHAEALVRARPPEIRNLAAALLRRRELDAAEVAAITTDEEA